MDIPGVPFASMWQGYESSYPQLGHSMSMPTPTRQPRIDELGLEELIQVSLPSVIVSYTLYCEAIKLIGIPGRQLLSVDISGEPSFGVLSQLVESRVRVFTGLRV